MPRGKSRAAPDSQLHRYRPAIGTIHEIPVFLAVQAGDDLLRSTLAERFGRDVRSALRDRLHRGIERFSLDDAFDVLPAGRAMARGIGLPELNLGEGLLRHLAVRGEIEVDDITRVPETLNGNPVLADPVVGTYLTCLNDNPIGTGDEVAARLNLAALRAGGLDGDGVAIAIVDSGINLDWLEQRLGFRPKLDAAYSWRPPGVNVEPGAYPMGHGTMCAYAALLAAPKGDADRRSGLHRHAGRRIGDRAAAEHRLSGDRTALRILVDRVHGVGRAEVQGARDQQQLGHVSSRRRLSGPASRPLLGQPAARVHAQHLGDLRDRPCRRRLRGRQLRRRMPGRKVPGRTTSTITGANACLDVLTVAGCDLSDERVGYSSQGPGISGMAANKPDVAAYTHFLGSEALGPGKPDKGTSAAGPLVAGCIAALRTRLDPAVVSPAALNEHLRRAARKPLGGDWNKDIGFGIVDPVAAAVDLSLVS